MFGAESGHIGPYELRGELGRGAMARVWRAWDPNLEREVAIKEPLFDYRLTPEVLAELGRRFVAEGRTAAKLNHPGIVSIYAADVWDGRPAIVMELVDGSTLSDLLTVGALPPKAALNILDQLLDAVGYAHAHGVVHRDIKPDNIFVTKTGVVKLADFGIAHRDNGSATHATVVGTVLGTPGYMSPEQATGRPVDARSDLFSVGTVAYEMLTGANPFGAGDGSDATTLIYRIVHEPAPDLPPSASAGLPVDLRPAVMAALEKDPDRRPATAEAFKALLHGGSLPVGAADVVVPEPVHTTRTQTGQGGKMPSWLPYALVFAVGVIVLTVVFLSATSGTRGGGGGAPAPVSAPAATQEQATEGSDATAEQPAEQAAESTEAVEPAAEQGMYLGIYEDEVALFREGQEYPIERMGLAVSSLSSENAVLLATHLKVASAEEAWEIVNGYYEEAGILQAAYPPNLYQAKASSELPGDAVTSYYGALNVLSSDHKLSWNEGATGDGIGEWVMVYASNPQRVRGLEIVNGYPKTQEIYYYNNRCKDVTIELSDGTQFDVTLEDAFGEVQTIDFGKEHAITSAKVTIRSVYEGSKWTDTSICIIRAY